MSCVAPCRVYTCPVARISEFNPGRKISAAFLITILVGTVLLMLPASRSGAAVATSFDVVAPHAIPTGVPVFGPSFADGAPLSIALFTAASATSVTGLIVVDTGSYWSAFGQAVIFLLIELGGIGTMTMVTLFASALRKRATFEDRAIAKVWFGLTPREVRHSVGQIVVASLLLQLGFAFLNSLYLWFSGHATSPLQAMAHGVFLTGSAFNNAGFAPYQDSLMSFSTEPFLLLSLGALIVIGGLGFPVWLMLYRNGWHWWKWGMTTRIMLLGTAAAIVFGWVAITVLEWHNPHTFGAMPVPERLLNGLFSSISPRTAGFNSVDISQQYPETWLITDGLMLIGGGPAGTAGGLKITTAIVVMATLWGEIRGAHAINILGWRLARSAQRQALAVLSLFFGLVAVGAFLLMLFTPFNLNQCLFEICSALGTVGLSTGITPLLPVAAQFMVIIFMILGRIGPLTLAAALATRRRPVAYELPRDHPLIG